MSFLSNKDYNGLPVMRYASGSAKMVFYKMPSHASFLKWWQLFCVLVSNTPVSTVLDKKIIVRCAGPTANGPDDRNAENFRCVQYGRQLGSFKGQFRMCYSFCGSVCTCRVAYKLSSLCV